MAGIKRLQTEAATITPAANPVSALCTLLPNVFFIKKTQAEPAVVPIKGIKSPINTLLSNITIAFFLALVSYL